MIGAILAALLASAPVCVEPATVATSSTTRLLTVTERDLYRVGERARANAERYRLLLDACEVERGRLSDSLATSRSSAPHVRERGPWAWPVIGAGLGAGVGAFAGHRVAGWPGALVGAMALAGLASALGVLLAQ